MVLVLSNVWIVIQGIIKTEQEQRVVGDAKLMSSVHKSVLKIAPLVGLEQVRYKKRVVLDVRRAV